MGYTKELHEAVAFLQSLRVGLHLNVARPGTTPLRVAVTRAAHRSDGPFGAYESTRITVSAKNGYAFDVAAESLVSAVTDDRIRGRVADWQRVTVSVADLAYEGGQMP